MLWSLVTSFLKYSYGLSGVKMILILWTNNFRCNFDSKCLNHIRPIVRFYLDNCWSYFWCDDCLVMVHRNLSMLASTKNFWITITLVPLNDFDSSLIFVEHSMKKNRMRTFLRCVKITLLILTTCMSNKK